MLYNTNYGEGMPISLIEGMGMGLAIVTRPVAGIPDIIEDGVNGLLVEPDISEQLGVALERLLGDKALQEKMATPLRIAVNLSARQFSQKNLYKTIEKILLDTKLDPQYLELEITESTAMEDAESTIKIMQQLKNIGADFSLDDFGTGYSSLAYLKRFPLTTLKIDRSFIKDLPDDEEAAAIVKAILAMAQSLKFEIIAEGVETKQQLSFLQNMGCANYQGHLFSEAITSEEIVELLEKKN